MPELARFLGIVIGMFYREQNLRSICGCRFEILRLICGRYRAINHHPA